MEVVHQRAYYQLVQSEVIFEDVPETPVALSATTPTVGPARSNSDSLEQRAECGPTTAVMTDRSQTFVDWDVQISPVIIGSGRGITIIATSGFSVANSVNVSAGGDLGVGKDKLDFSFGVDYSHTWPSSALIKIGAIVEDGYSGCMITKPINTRKYGRIMKGCLGSQRQTGTFMADSFEESRRLALSGLLVDFN
ncbi:hypothetical protein NW762_010197 [Fusarium torreyae]|uniref:Uncharacterized protein n=1 Tax=Fusarium torreyae TaxID=1237075 RepID=A0A9W8RVS9_9HYPO|nr:hypothetical protein NW762_010197 [Fusarium torreyae]